MLRYIKRLIKRPRWYNLRVTTPISSLFGYDRGTPIDRYYIEKFLKEKSHLIKGTVLEIADDTYTKKFGIGVLKSEILHYTRDNPLATIIGDLSKKETLPHGIADCFICTQTFNFIYDFNSAVEGAYKLLKPNGVLLVTLGGISQISRFDMDRWGDYWRFTTLSANRIFSDVFGAENVSVSHYGNPLTSIAFLHGISAEELNLEELEARHEDYQMLITVIAIKR